MKPGKPYTHSFDRVRGRLHISQATLAVGTSAKKSLVQCNVGDKSPVLLCALLPDKTESLQLDLEFEETEDVIFSVIGPRGVHLTGYYVGGCRNSNFQDDTESYGEDINTDTEESNRCADEEEDEYEDSFINDGEPEALTPSPVSSDGVDEEVYIQKRRDGKGGRNRLKKKYQLVESDDETCSQQNIANGSIGVPESDDDDKFPISSVCKSKTTTANMIPEVAEEKSNEVTVLTLEAGDKMKEDDGINPKTETDGSHVIDLKENFDVHFTNDEPKRKGDPHCTSLLPTSEEVPESRTKAKKKRKELSKQGKNIDDILKESKPQPDEVIAQKSGEYLLVDDKPDLEVATDKTSAVPCNSSARTFEAGLENGKKSKKKRKGHSKKGEIHEDDSGRCGDSLKEDKGQQAEAEPDNIDQDVPLRNKDDRTTNEMTIDRSHESMLPSVDMCPERSSRGKKKRKEQTEIEADFSGSDLLIRTEQDKKSTTDKSFNIVSDQLGDGYRSDDKKLKKKRRKKSKTEDNEENGNMEVKEENNRSAMESEKNVDARSSEVRTLSNGLRIEELGMRNSKGKKAAPGKKVKVQYIVKLKESGHVIDSNIGKSPYKFRLGDNEVIEGLNVGLEGMRVGDKRRLIIPPSMSSGSEGAGENIPPNSWLVYDVDLVGVH